MEQSESIELQCMRIGRAEECGSERNLSSCVHRVEGSRGEHSGCCTANIYNDAGLPFLHAWKHQSRHLHPRGQTYASRFRS